MIIDSLESDSNITDNSGIISFYEEIQEFLTEMEKNNNIYLDNFKNTFKINNLLYVNIKETTDIDVYKYIMFYLCHHYNYISN